MIGLLAATQPARTIVIERGGSTPWWVPLLVALAAAAATYYATWRFKNGDVNRENAFRVAGLIDEVERITDHRRGRYDEEGGADTTIRLIIESQVRARPIQDSDLDDRLRAALAYNVALRDGKEEVPRSRHWLSVAIWNVQRALAQHLSAPRLLPRTTKTERVFPTFEDLIPMIPMTEGRVLGVSPDLSILDAALAEWQANERRKPSRSTESVRGRGHSDRPPRSDKREASDERKHDEERQSGH